MKIVCESCQAKYSIADEKVTGKVFKIRCKRCGEVIVVRGDQEPPGEEATRVYDYAQDAVWHAVINGDQQGPFAPQQLGEMLTAGTLDWDAYVWCEGFDNWLPMRDVPDLVAAITGQGQPSGGGGMAAAAAPAAASRTQMDYSAQPSMGADPFADDGGGGGGGLFDEPAPAAAAPDLFGGGGGGSPFDSGRGRVVSSSPTPRVSAEQAAMTGARNENSVLFSLKNLQALATGSTTSAATSSGASDFGGGGMSAMAGGRDGFAAGEGSGLIDIRALATATGVGASDASEEKDELLSIGSQTGAFGSLGSPMLSTVATEDGGGKKMIVWASVAGVAFLSVAAVAVAFILRPAPQAAPPPVAATAVVAPAAAAPAPAAAAPSAEDAPSEGELLAKAEAAKATKSGESSGSSSGSRRRKAGGGDEAPGAAAGDAPAGDAPAEKPAEKKKFDSSSASIDDLLSNALTPGSGSKPKPPPPKEDDNLQPKPTRDQVLEAMNGVKGEVQACAQGATGVAFAEVTVSGATGRVTNAQISGQTGAIGSCIARVVRKAKFPKFKEATFQVKFPYRLQ